MSAGALTDAEVLGTLSFAQEMKETDESKLQSLRDGVQGYAENIAQDIENIQESMESSLAPGTIGIALAVAGVAIGVDPEISQSVGSTIADYASATGLTAIVENSMDQVLDVMATAATAVGSALGGLSLAKMLQENQTLQEAKELHAEVSERAELLDQVLEGESIDLSSVEQKDTGENISPSWAVSDEKGKSDISR